ncbi:DUF6338 family protein [Glutamicibacter sp. NPDC087344]|uniref:DUF6338 family protein n=1 Tax=Glutamicibacter sp. NPDC087344 TaxID=3363994 RepID=UPI00382044DF
MPTDPIMALVYVALLLPGVLFLHQREKNSPRTRRSAFRETATIVLASASTHLILLAISIVLAMILGSFVPPVLDFVRGALTMPEEVFKKWPIESVWVLFYLFTGSCLLATYAGTNKVWDGVVSIGGSGRIERRESAWSRLLAEPDATDVYVTVVLQSGTVVKGRYRGHNPDVDEPDSRELMLQRPIYLRGAESGQFEESNEEFALFKSAEIDYITVRHVRQ